MFAQMLRREVPVDQKALFDVLRRCHLSAANLAGQVALEQIVAGAAQAGRALEARAEEAPQTLAERLGAGEAEWNQVAGNFVFNLREPTLLRELGRRGAQITGDVSANMMGDLHSTLVQQVYRAGQSPRAIAAKLDAIFPTTYRNRGENIARTEVAIAQGLVTHATYQRNGVGDRQWFALLDGATRPGHAAAHGQVRPLAQPFLVDGENMMHPGDPGASVENVAGCRCDELPVIDGATALPAQPWAGGYQPNTPAAKASAAPIRRR
jgi:uncharacterized protein with gpF-like domain